MDATTVTLTIQGTSPAPRELAVRASSRSRPVTQAIGLVPKVGFKERGASRAEGRLPRPPQAPRCEPATRPDPAFNIQSHHADRAMIASGGHRAAAHEFVVVLSMCRARSGRLRFRNELGLCNWNPKAIRRAEWASNVKSEGHRFSSDHFGGSLTARHEKGSPR